MLRRFAHMEIRAEESGPVSVIASTDVVLQRGTWYREQLLHGPENVILAAETALRNHDPDQIVGRLENLRLDGGKIRADIIFAPTALGRETEDLVRGRFLRGISVGYTIEDYTREEDSSGIVTIRAIHWTVREVSLTPIPADLAAGVGREEDATTWRSALGLRDLSAPTTPPVRPATAGVTMDHVQTPAADPAALTARAEKAERTLHLMSVARSHGVEIDPADLAAVDSREAGLELLLQRKAKATTSHPTAPVGGRSTAATITVDEKDKIRDEAIDAMFAGRALSDALRKYGLRMGLPGIQDMSRNDLLEAAALGVSTLGRATFVSSDLGTITQLAAAKAMHEGYQSYVAQHPMFAREVFVPDFNTVTISGLGIGELAASGSGEGGAYADATLEVAGGSGSNEFLGKNFDVSLVAMYNDRIGIVLQTMRDLGRTGARTLDKIAFAALEAASFASATQALAFSEANLATAWGAHAAVTIPGVPAKRLIVPPALYVGARAATTPSNGGTAGRPLAEQSDVISVVNGWYLTDANDWYLVADPADAPVIALLRHPDYLTPRLVAKGEGGGPTALFRIDFPAKAVLLTRATGKPLCAYKCTQS